MQEKYLRVYEIGKRCYQKSKLTTDERKYLRQCYYDLKLTWLPDDCSNCFAKIYQYFLTLKNKPIMQSQKCDFKLKQGKKIMLHGMSDVLTNENITNEKALLFLKAAPGCSKFFEVLPDNWREQSAALGKANGYSDAAPAAKTKEAAPEKKFEADEFDLEKTRRDNLTKKSEKQLLEMCASLEVDESLYMNTESAGKNKTKKTPKTKAELVEVLMQKTA